MSTHNLCFGAKIRKIVLPLQTPVLLYKSGVYIARTCFSDALCNLSFKIVKIYMYIYMLYKHT